MGERVKMGKKNFLKIVPAKFANFNLSSTKFLPLIGPERST